MTSVDLKVRLERNDIHLMGSCFNTDRLFIWVTVEITSAELIKRYFSIKGEI